MKRALMLVLVLTLVVLGLVGSASAAWGGGIDPFSVSVTRSFR
ncbi:MAG TPA: hypothetical protein VGK74_27000 [Symbiobacteriaceae bacterium]|jgi:hypothetical protein